MQSEWIAVIAIIICLFILSLEYLWLAMLSKSRSDSYEKYKNISLKVAQMVEGILYSPTANSRQNEIKALKELMGNDYKIFEMISAQLCFWEEYGDENSLGNKTEVIDEVYAVLDPEKLFSDLLKANNKYTVGYACRRLADFDAYDYLSDVLELSKAKKRDVAYNAAMALSRYGYAEGVADFIVRIENDKKYSFRLVNELFDTFSADKAELAAMVFDKCEDYMKINVIKAISEYRLSEFEPMYIEGMSSKNPAMRIACVKALGDLANPENEQLLITATYDKDWVVRSSAVKGLGKINTPKSLEGIKEAIKDKEWWVRQSAAGALINRNVSVSDIEDILGGYDKYAADAVKYALYRSIDMKEG